MRASERRDRKRGILSTKVCTVQHYLGSSDEILHDFSNRRQNTKYTPEPCTVVYRTMKYRRKFSERSPIPRRLLSSFV